MTATTSESSVFSENMLQASQLYQQVLQELLAHSPEEVSSAALDPFHVAGAFTEMFAKLAEQPAALLQSQLYYAENFLKLFDYTMRRLLGQEAQPLYVPAPRDARFKDPAWDRHPYFDFLKQSYLMTSDWLQRTVANVEGLDEQTRRKVMFFTRQYLDALSPTNYWLTNPEVLKTTLDSKGENLVKGLENLLSDLKHSKKGLQISTTDFKAFDIGRNLAATPGKVIYQNEMMQLIHYQPAGKETYALPLLIVPPWINKYYILDLGQENSFVKWLVDQGYSVFLISWVNPDERYAPKNFEDYMQEGVLAALEAVNKASGQKQLTAIGYCLGGTLLASTLAYMKAKKDTRIKASAFLTTLLDFADAGDLLVFVDDASLKNVEQKMNERGYFDGIDMSSIFNMLRANDMIWSFVVNNYLLGKQPLPFDLLYWNADTTRLPAAMQSFYLRNMYQNNLLAKPGGIRLGGVPINLSSIDIPAYFLSTREDHIAPWQATYKGAKMLADNVRFVLAASGHVAGVVNPPIKQKYCYWLNENNSLPDTPAAWLEQAKEHAGSWWTDWHEWNRKFSTQMLPAPLPGMGALKAIEEAPGSYVKVRVGDKRN